MKHHIENLIASALAGLEATGALPPAHGAAITVDHTKSKEHGDYACNIALIPVSYTHLTLPTILLV